MIADPQNMGQYTLFCQISAILAEILWKIEFSIMAALICIKMIRGTFCWLVNIANRFLRIFSDLLLPIKSIFHGVHGTQLFRLDYCVQSVILVKIIKACCCCSLSAHMPNQSARNSNHSVEVALVCVSHDILRAIDTSTLSSWCFWNCRLHFDTVAHNDKVQSLHVNGYTSQAGGIDWDKCVGDCPYFCI